SLLALYELQTVKSEDGMQRYRSDIDALEQHTSRINEIFVSLVKKVLDGQNNDKDEFNKNINKRDKLIEELQTSLQEAKQRSNAVSAQLNEMIENQAEIKRQTLYLEELNETRKQTIDNQLKEIE